MASGGGVSVVEVDCEGNDCGVDQFAALEGEQVRVVGEHLVYGPEEGAEEGEGGLDPDLAVGVEQDLEVREGRLEGLRARGYAHGHVPAQVLADW